MSSYLGEVTDTKANLPDEITSENIWALSQDRGRCRMVQKYLEDQFVEQPDSSDLVAGLHDHVWDALVCPNANHVLQTIINNARPPQFEFILNEILAKGDKGITEASEHRFGCRIMQALLKELHAAYPSKVQPVFTVLIDNAVDLSMQRFGTFVIDFMLKCKLEEGVETLFDTLKGDVKKIVSDDNGALVLCTALGSEQQNFKEADQVALAKEILDSVDICQMATTRHGNVTIRHAINKVDRKEQEAPIAKLLADRENISSHRYGRLVIQFAENHSKEMMQEVSA